MTTWPILPNEPPPGSDLVERLRDAGNCKFQIAVGGMITRAELLQAAELIHAMRAEKSARVNHDYKLFSDDGSVPERA